ncbi:TetR family transcriptional regulator [Tamaricihabitans halophyticus]|uniref:TetR family transcriptional regulator n=1 Tax=Tamaricihabitans halophyticus TaxID=1262583 RepID=A0A4R2R650_9PSEU|nr:TetR/AcrR family transcriptional regulator [Tamaricihabitans halophyticus]TCP57507.1 TetR family transcriptional regulator [Tamaricihabitans halophyticus]
MARLSRVEQQERNKAKVLAAARAEFAERGYREAKVDAIAERAELTRGAVYSNFPGKRALYFAVLAELAAEVPIAAHVRPGENPVDALGAFAGAWMARLPASGFGVDMLSEVRAEELTRRPFTQLLKLNALVLSLALEHLAPPVSIADAPPRRFGRLAETVLTTLYGAGELATAAPGFGEPFDVISACERLAGMELNDWWAPPEQVTVPVPDDLPWSAPEMVDRVRAEPVELAEDGLLAVVGLHRLAVLEEAVRAGGPVTAVLVTSAPAELLPLAQLVLAQLSGCLRQAFPRSAWPALRIVCDQTGAVAKAAGLSAVSDATEAAVRISGGRITARAEGPGACHAIGARTPQRR